MNGGFSRSLPRLGGVVGCILAEPRATADFRRDGGARQRARGFTSAASVDSVRDGGALSKRSRSRQGSRRTAPGEQKGERQALGHLPGVAFAVLLAGGGLLRGCEW